MSIMMRRVSNRWFEIQRTLRQYPWLDYVLGSVLFLWGWAAIICPDQVTVHSHFSRLASVIYFVAFLSIVIGATQVFCAWSGRKHLRPWISCLGLWLLFGLWLYVNSITGKLAWGALSFEELLICLAVV